ncbi:hypothetical protein [Chitinophaga vietnamensis]|uniref:hypothetical protein n=1 Tax=Chitinophaga vietnamensis TaxID=2593957 RepID=UPI00117737F4|nr:hypothetical protein [Chitinophaga vietnamensis]
MNAPDSKSCPHLHARRDEDVHHPYMCAAEIIAQFFPPNISASAFGLSDTITAFYGLVLQRAALLNGPGMIDALSQAAIYELGKRKTAEALDACPDLDKDARSVFLILIIAFFSSSTECKFKVVEFKPELVRVVIKGVDHYHRMATELNIVTHLTWPVFLPFLRGAIDMISSQLFVYAQINQLADDSSCNYELTIRHEVESRQAPISQIAMTPPFFTLPEGKISSYGHLLYAPIGHAHDFEAADFVNLIKTQVSMEAYNNERIHQPRSTQYMSGISFRAIRCGAFERDTEFNMLVESQLVNNRKRKSTAKILTDRGEQVYQLLFHYYSLDETTFQEKFETIKTTEPVIPATGELPLPRIKRTNFTDPYAYRAVLSPFEYEHCAGHFPGYPLVPVLLVYQCMATEDEKWLREQIEIPSSIRPVVDNIEMFPVRIMPVKTVFLVDISVYRLSKQVFKFVHKVMAVEAPAKLHAIITIDMEVPPLSQA